MNSAQPRGFTLTEMVITTAIIGVAAAAALIVSGGQTAAVQLREAGRLLASDLELAQLESVTHSAAPRGLLFNADGSGYRVIDLSQPSLALADPLGGGRGTTFGEGRASHLDGVRMYAHTAGADNLIAFGPFGQLDQAEPFNLALISGDRGLIVGVDSDTGAVAIGQLEPLSDILNQTTGWVGDTLNGTLVQVLDGVSGVTSGTGDVLNGLTQGLGKKHGQNKDMGGDNSNGGGNKFGQNGGNGKK